MVDLKNNNVNDFIFYFDVMEYTRLWKCCCQNENDCIRVNSTFRDCALLFKLSCINLVDVITLNSSGSIKCIQIVMNFMSRLDLII